MCPVCLEGLRARLRVTAPCGHAACLGCFQRLPAPPRCPLCRADLAPLVPPPPPPPSPPRTPPELVVPLWGGGASSETVRALAGRVAAAEELRGELRRSATSRAGLRRAPSLREAALLRGADA